MIGRTLGNYRIIEQIGMGGMATVKAYDPSMVRLHKYYRCNSGLCYNERWG